MDLDDELRIECMSRDKKCPYKVALKELFGLETNAICTNRMMLFDLYDAYQFIKKRRITVLEYPDEF